jgi:hypothetical protein
MCCTACCPMHHVGPDDLQINRPSNAWLRGMCRKLSWQQTPTGRGGDRDVFVTASAPFRHKGYASCLRYSRRQPIWNLADDATLMRALGGTPGDVEGRKHRTDKKSRRMGTFGGFESVKKLRFSTETRDWTNALRRVAE